MPQPDLLLQMTCDVAADISLLPDAAGVYVFFWARPLIPLCDYCAEAETISPEIELVPLYTGASADSLRMRIKRHVLGDTRGSTLRASLGLLLQAHLNLTIIPIPTKAYFCFEPEQRLTDWIVSNTVIGHFETDDPFGLEKGMLADEAGLLNIQGCPATEISVRLKTLRSNASGRLLPLPH